MMNIFTQNKSILMHRDLYFWMQFCLCTQLLGMLPLAAFTNMD